MIRGIAKAAISLAAGLTLASAGLATLWSGPVSAATSVTSYWGTNNTLEDGGQYPCGTTWEINQGANRVDEVSNPCNTRVWVHYYSDSSGEVQQYCINPDGGLAYGIPMAFSSSVTYADIQLTSNTSACDAGAAAAVTWENSNLQSAGKSYACAPGDTFTYSGLNVGGIANNCDFRIWLHGSGNRTLCINPGGSNYPGYDSPYSQLQMTDVQAPCSAKPVS